MQKLHMNIHLVVVGIPLHIMPARWIIVHFVEMQWPTASRSLIAVAVLSVPFPFPALTNQCTLIDRFDPSAETWPIQRHANGLP